MLQDDGVKERVGRIRDHVFSEQRAEANELLKTSERDIFVKKPVRVKKGDVIRLA